MNVRVNFRGKALSIFGGGLARACRPRWRAFLCFGSIALLATTVGGWPSQPEPAPTRLEWPSPPERTRIIYRHSFSRAADLGWKRAWWRKVADWLMNETDPSVLVQPYAIAFDDHWRMIIADIGSHEVKIFDPVKKNVKRIRGYKKKMFGLPLSLAVDDQENIYVADSAAGRVLKYSPEGKLLAFIGGEEGAFPVPPALPSSLWGVGGIKQDGTSRSRTTGTDDSLVEYEICFKCHADSTNKPQTTDYSTTGIGYGRYPMRYGDFSGVGNCNNALPTRGNARNEFSLSTVSYHPVVKALNHTVSNFPPYGMPSLRPFVQDINGNNITSRPLTITSIIYCGDCHNSDTGRDTVSTRTNTTSPAGLHGSINIHILERTNILATASNSAGACSTGNGGGTGYTLTNYKLCDKCHDITNSILADKSFNQHSSHVQGGDADTACSTCHDPHASPQGGLVNFDKAVVGPSSSGQIIFVKKTSTTQGSCTLTCHGQDHNGTDYTY